MLLRIFGTEKHMHPNINANMPDLKYVTELEKSKVGGKERNY